MLLPHNQSAALCVICQKNLYVMRLSKNTWLLALGLACVLPLLAAGCSRKSGCPAYESVHTPTNRKGELSNKRGKSAVFPKKMNR